MAWRVAAWSLISRLPLSASALRMAAGLPSMGRASGRDLPPRRRLIGVTAMGEGELDEKRLIEAAQRGWQP
jgi:hypothetical protein